MNNLNPRNRQTTNISLAAMCIKRLKDGEPCTDAMSRNNGQGRLRDYRDLEGGKVTEARMVEIMGVTRDTVRDLYSRYNGDCDKMLKNHGYTNTRLGVSITKYKDQDGQKMTQRAVAKKYGISSKLVHQYFVLHAFDHVKAFESILKYIEKRDLKPKGGEL